MNEHTPGPWVDSHVSDAIVSKGPLRGEATELEIDAYHYYGGYCICESVEPRNKAIIKASPLLYKALDAFDKLLLFDSPIDACTAFVIEGSNKELLAAIDRKSTRLNSSH